jgi:hypothetical protein
MYHLFNCSQCEVHTNLTIIYLYAYIKKKLKAFFVFAVKGKCSDLEPNLFHVGHLMILLQLAGRDCVLMKFKVCNVLHEQYVHIKICYLTLGVIIDNIENKPIKYLLIAVQSSATNLTKIQTPKFIIDRLNFSEGCHILIRADRSLKSVAK